MSANGMYIVQGEMTQVVTALRRSRRFVAVHHTAPHHQLIGDPQQDELNNLLRNFEDLREVLQTVSDLNEVRPSVFLSPFLDVIKSEHTNGPVTGLALSAVAKFLSYSLVDSTHITAASAVDRIADAVTHARFVGTETGSDEVVLLKILQVLRTLLLTTVGSLLTNEAVCEILQSCFRICFEMRLSELLRRAAESTLSDMIQLLFTRLPTFTEDPRDPYIRKCRLRAITMSHDIPRRLKKYTKAKRARAAAAKLAETAEEEQETSQPPEQEQTAAPPDTVAPVEQPAAAEQQPQPSTAAPEEQEQQQQRSSVSHVVIDMHESLVPPGDPDSPPTSDHYLSDDEKEQTGSVLVKMSASRTEDDLSQSKQLHSEVFSQDSGVDDPSDRLSAPAGIDENEHHSDHEDEPLNLRGRRSGGITFTTGNGDSVLTSPMDPTQPSSAAPALSPCEASPTAAAANSQLNPYGLTCIRELFRFLVSLSNPLDKQNSEHMIQLAISLLAVALEAGVDYIGSYTVLMPFVRNELCRNLQNLLSSDRLPLFAAALRAAFLMLEGLRTHLKLQLEAYLTKLMEIVLSENQKISFEKKEIALEAIVQLWRIPGLVTELYLNYDCDQYCSNLFEDLTKLLSKNSFPVAGIFTTHLLSLDALITIVDTIEGHCHYQSLNIQQRAPDGSILSAPVPPSLPAHVRPNRMPVVLSQLPSSAELAIAKQRKRIWAEGTLRFNKKPKDAVEYLQSQGMLVKPADPMQVARWIRENPRLDKAMISEYICNKKHGDILAAFVHTFPFEHVRVDDALRAFLETFRLPGEAPVISMLLEHFASHWHTSNDEPFASSDAAFTLAYAIIMLNVDQHNMNARKQNIPMTPEQFKRNLKGVNGGGEFEEELLNDIFHSIKGEEIVMPSEQTGQVRENYNWKVLLRRSTTKDGVFRHATNGMYDTDLFNLIWGPTVAAISFVFDKSANDASVARAINGFRKCAAIAAHYNMFDIFDNLICSLCKFTSICSSVETAQLPLVFGANTRSQLAAKMMFQLVHLHGDILRDGWKNVLECLLALYSARLLPAGLTESEDFIDAKGWISIQPETAKNTERTDEGGLFSSIYTFLGSSSHDLQAAKAPTAEEQRLFTEAQNCIAECHPDAMIADSRYITSQALIELISHLCALANRKDAGEDTPTSAHPTAAGSPASPGPGSPQAMTETQQNYSTVFLLELLVRIAIENKDRVTICWASIRSHVQCLLVHEAQFVAERAAVALLRMTSRFLFREELVGEMVESLGFLTTLPFTTLRVLSPHISHGLHHMLKSNAANIHSQTHWNIVFTLLEVVGAAAEPRGGPPVAEAPSPADSDAEEPSAAVRSRSSDRGYVSDSEIANAAGEAQATVGRATTTNNIAEWTVVNSKGEEATAHHSPVTSGGSSLLQHSHDLTLRTGLHRHDTVSFTKCCETLAFVARDAAHITPENFESCVCALRTFIEASLNGGKRHQKRAAAADDKGKKRGSAKSGKKGKKGAVDDSPKTEEETALAERYVQLSLQLLDLAHKLHEKSAEIYGFGGDSPRSSAMPIDLWTNGWRPLLQCMARLCCDSRPKVYSAALNTVAPALLNETMKTHMTAYQWEDCFISVLFPLLSYVYQHSLTAAAGGLSEEICFRLLSMLSKVFLAHLAQLTQLQSFVVLWTTIVYWNAQYFAKGIDSLVDAVPQNLTNALLVMNGMNIFAQVPGLFETTATMLQQFQPNLLSEVFPNGPPVPPVPVVDPQPLPPVPMDPQPHASPLDLHHGSPMHHHIPQEHQQATQPVENVPPPPEEPVPPT